MKNLTLFSLSVPLSVLPFAFMTSNRNILFDYFFKMAANKDLQTINAGEGVEKREPF